MPRSLSEPEFTALYQAVVMAAPPGLDEAAFTRYFKPALAGAVGEAEQTPAPPQGSQTWTALKTFASDLNPWPVVKAIADVPLLITGQPTSGAGRSFLRSLWTAHHATGQQAAADIRQGRLVEGVARAVAAAVPGVGPLLNQAGTAFAEGRTGEAVGHTAALLAPVAGAAALRGRALKTPTLKTPNPTEAAAVDFVASRGVPVDLGTASGNRWVQNVQQVAEHSTPVGAVLAERAQQGRASALSRVGQELAGDVNAPGPNTRGLTSPGPVVTPEQAGSNVAASGVQKIQALDALADRAYSQLRAFEAAPEHSTRVLTAPVDSPAFQRILTKLQAGLPEGMTAPTTRDLTIMRQIEVELESQPFTRRLLRPGQHGSSLEHVEGTGGAGAPVFHDIGQATGYTGTRADMLAGLKKTLETGDWTQPGQGAFVVARQRQAKSGALTGPSLPNDAPLLGKTERMGLAVSLTDAKQALTPLYEQLSREGQLVPLQGAKGRALVALDRLMRAPEQAPLSVVDAALGDLKAMARGALLPELRTQGQGSAAAAVQALDTAVRRTALAAGPKVFQALLTGRKATAGKYVIAEIYDKLRAEPVQAFRQATAAGDASIRQLRDIQRMAPDELPNIGRAYLESLFDKATQEGGFGRTDRLWADWKKLGPETRALLFRNKTTLGQLDAFFLAAKKLGQVANPSKSGFVGASALAASSLLANPLLGGLYQLAGSSFVILAHSPRFVRAFTKGASLPVGSAALPAAVVEVAAAARAAGVTWPKAAGGRPSTPEATSAGTERRR